MKRKKIHKVGESLHYYTPLLEWWDQLSYAKRAAELDPGPPDCPATAIYNIQSIVSDIVYHFFQLEHESDEEKRLIYIELSMRLDQRHGFIETGLRNLCKTLNRQKTNDDDITFLKVNSAILFEFLDDNLPANCRKDIAGIRTTWEGSLIPLLAETTPKRHARDKPMLDKAVKSICVGLERCAKTIRQRIFVKDRSWRISSAPVEETLTKVLEILAHIDSTATSAKDAAEAASATSASLLARQRKQDADCKPKDFITAQNLFLKKKSQYQRVQLEAAIKAAAGKLIIKGVTEKKNNKNNPKAINPTRLALDLWAKNADKWNAAANYSSREKGYKNANAFAQACCDHRNTLFGYQVK